MHKRFIQCSGAAGKVLHGIHRISASSHPSAVISHAVHTHHEDKIGQFLSTLLPEQLEAISGKSAAMRVKAGPGSGKTRVVTAKVAKLLASGTNPGSILVITFTNKAAEELKERLSSLLGPAAYKGLVTGTFHSICVRLLKSFITELPEAKLTSSFTVLDADDSERIMRKAMDSILTCDGFASRGKIDGKTANKLAGELFNAYSQLRSKHATLFNLNLKKIDLKVTPALEKVSSEYNATLPLIFEEYTRICRQSNGIDFDDLLSLTVALLRVPRVRDELSTRFKHCLVDEFQTSLDPLPTSNKDVNAAQYEMVRLLAGRQGNHLFVVGDPDQAIYGWRGADPSNMETMEMHFTDLTTAYLVKNFRSCPDVLGSAESLLSHGGIPKLHRALDPVKKDPGHVEMVVTARDRDEARWVANKIRELRDSGCPYNEMAVLYRTNICSRVLEEALSFSRIPFRVLGEKPFWSRSEIKGLTSYLRLVSNPSVDSAALDQIINLPPRGVGAKSEERLIEVAQSQGFGLATLIFRGIQETPFLTEQQLSPILSQVEQTGSLPDSALTLLPTIDAYLKELGVMKMTKDGLHGIQSLRVSIFIARSLCMARKSCAAAVKLISKISGYEAHVKEGKLGTNEDKKMAMIEILYNISAAPESWLFRAENVIRSEAQDQSKDGLSELRDLLSHIALMREMDEAKEKDEAQDRVSLMTLHTSKGLEFRAVFFVGLEEGLCPQLRPDSDLNEEKRLAYVGATRSKENLYLMMTKERNPFGGYKNLSTPPREPSRFLNHLMSSHHGAKVKRTLVGSVMTDDAYETGSSSSSSGSSSSYRLSPPPLPSSRSMSTGAKRSDEELKRSNKKEATTAAGPSKKSSSKSDLSPLKKSSPKPKPANGW